MTDLQRVTDLFTDLGILYTTVLVDGEQHVRLEVDREIYRKPELKVRGYKGFVSTYMFDENGKFLQVNIWE